MPAGRPKKLIPTKGIPVTTLDEKKIQIFEAFAEAVSMSKSLDLDDWADKYRILPREVASEHGQWVTARFPFLRRIMKCLSPSSIARMIVVQKGAQLGFTELAINWILYNSCQNPRPMIYCQKTDDAAKAFSNEKLKPSIAVTEAVYHTLGKGKGKTYANSWDHKAYPGGFVKLGGANSTSFLRGTSSPAVTLDEEDDYALNIGHQGNPAAIAGKRQVNFPDRKMFRPSTPVLKELSTIEPAREAGSDEYWYVPCPHCNPEGDHDGFMFVIEFDHLKWSKETQKGTDYPERVWVECPNCAGEIDEARHKTWMLAAGDWFSTKGLSKEELKENKRYKVGDVENVSFFIASFYSPFGFFSWADAVQEFFDYRRTKDVNLLQVIHNQTWAKTFSLIGRDIDYGKLYKRREAYADNNGEVFDVPENGLVLTAGCDVQDDRIEVGVKAWGLFEENWGVEHAVIPGNTALMGDVRGMLPDGQPSVWRLLDDFLSRRWRHQSGAELPIEVTMIDSGHKTDEVQTFCRLREHRRIFPIKGFAGWGKGMWEASRKRSEKYNTFLYKAYVDELKNKLYAQLQIDDPGPGYCHFPDRPEYSEKYFKGLTCETRKVKMVGGRKVLYWDTPSGARNEPIDISNYAYVAFRAYPVDLQARAEKNLAELFPPASGRGGTPSPRRRKRRRGSRGIV